MSVGLIRRGRIALQRLAMPLGLTQRFLVVSVVVIAGAMAALGLSISNYVGSSITQGIADTSAASIDSLIANSVNAMFASEALTSADRERLDALFEIGSDATATRLVQIRIFRLDGRLLYEASDGVIDPLSHDAFDTARAGTVTSGVAELPLEPAGPFGSHAISLLRLYTPLHRPGTGETFAVAVLYYSALSLLTIRTSVQFAVWSLVLVVGVLVLAALMAFVATAERTIVRQASNLSANLAESRRLSEEVRGLHQASEQLRVDAIEANEQLLARVGSDIHDGPLQLLTLVILQLRRALNSRDDDAAKALRPTVELTADAVAELRSISVGLVLPELDGLTLADTILLAIRHYEGATGTQVRRQLSDLDWVAEQDVQVCLYRIVQESLTNAFRHSGGVDQAVTAESVAGRVNLTISNAKPSDGGLTADTPLRPKLGLRGMRLRVEAVGGGLIVEMDATGVVVRATIPTSGSAAGT